jgi:preprotein translocase subunit SecF
MKKQMNFDFIGHRRIFLIITACVFAVGIILNIIFGISMSVSFKGGTLMRYSYTGEISELAPIQQTVKSVLGDAADVSIESANDTDVLSITLTDTVTIEQQEKLIDALQKDHASYEFKEFSINTLKASMGKLFFVKCLVAVALAALFLLIYVGLRFRKIGGLSAGAMALLALLHDLCIVYFTFVAFGIQLDDNFVAVMLAILGYSLNDTIVVYDRIRENRGRMKDAPITEIVNTSLNQTFGRTLNTSICVALAIGTAAVFAIVLRMDTITSFAVPMLFGVVAGFYSSVCLTPSLWALWAEKRQAKKKA